MSRIKKLCPLLEGMGVFDEPGLGADMNWVKTLCRECPLPECIYDYRGQIKEEDEKALLDKLSEMKEEK